MTSSFFSTPRLTWEAMGWGVPKRMSETSVAIMEPPQPSLREVRRACSRMFTGSLSTPMWVRCMVSTTSRSMPRGAILQLVPEFQPGGGQAFGKGQVAFLDAELGHHGQGQFFGLGLGRQVGRQTVFRGDAVQFGQIGQLITRRLTLGHGQQGFHQVAAMVGMGGGPGGNHPGQVAGHDDVGVGAADAPLGSFAEGIETAGTHDADRGS